MKKPMSNRRKFIHAVLTLLVAELEKAGWKLDDADVAGEHGATTCRTVQRAVDIFRVYDVTHVYFYFNHASNGSTTSYVKLATDGGREVDEYISDWSYSNEFSSGRNFNRVVKRVQKIIETHPVKFC